MKEDYVSELFTDFLNEQVPSIKQMEKHTREVLLKHRFIPGGMTIVPNDFSYEVKLYVSRTFNAKNNELGQMIFRDLQTICPSVRLSIQYNCVGAIR